MNTTLIRKATIIAVAVAAIASFGWGFGPSDSQSTATTGQAKAGEQAGKADKDTSPAAGAKETKPPFEKLVGKWRRPDGGYLLEIKQVDGQGNLEAGYYNPRPINVSQARASADGAMAKVYIEMRDVNYPGSNYNLVYDAKNDILSGIYFQAVQKQRFEVIFVREN